MNQRVRREIQHFEGLAKERGTCWWGNETAAGQLRLDRRGKSVVEFTGIGPGSRVLELGCATGHFTSRLVKSGATITAIDVTRALIELARQAVLADNVQFKVADAYALPFNDGSFDAVVGYSVLHHLSLSLALPEAWRVLVSGGKAWFSEPNMLNPEIFLERNVRFIGRIMQNSPDETALVKRRARQAFVDCGFRNVTVKPFDFLHPIIPAGLISAATVCGSLFERIPLIKETAGSLEIRAEK